MTFRAFYSDPHFGHVNFCNRPFSSWEAMTKGMVERYNSVIAPEDFVLWCGDCFWCGAAWQQAEQTLKSMHGRKALVRGNHDRSAAKMASVGFEFVVSEMELPPIAGRPVRVSHFPYFGTGDARDSTRFVHDMPRRKPNSGEVLIHGHTHSARKRDGNMIHVGCDAWEYRPALFEEVEALIKEV